MNDGLANFGAAVGEVMAELDWELLGRGCCEGDGAEFFDAALRARIVEAGAALAGQVGAALGDRQGTSLYLGAEIAELPVILAEHLVLGRRIEWLNLDGPSVREIARAIAAVGARLDLALPIPTTRALADVEPASCDHLWIVSVLSDPEHFPALHDALYGRAGGPLATGRGRIEDDRARAAALVEALLDRAAATCVVTTTDEERTIIEPLVAERGGSLVFTRGGTVTAIVGDRARTGILRRAPGPA